MNDIRIKSLSKHYLGKVIFNDVNVTIVPMKYILKGSNSAGKSTFLNMLCELEKPNSGDIKIDGSNKHFDLVSDRVVIPSELKVFIIFKMYDKFSRSDISKRNQLINEFDFSQYYYSSVSSLSTGTLQKLKLILALSGNSNWLFLDEPFNGLDTHSIEVLCRLIAKENRPLILVDHSYHLDQSDCKKIIIENQKICIKK